jgi:hypothetical protein
MATITEDIVLGHGYTEDDRGGQLVRRLHIRGLPSTSAITDDAIIASDGTRVTPKAGQQHPTMPDMRVRKVDVRPSGNSRDSVYVDVTYVKVRRRLLDVRYSGVTYNGTTNLDRDGKILFVGYKGPATVGGAVTKPGVVFPDPDPTKPGQGGYAYDFAPDVPMPLPQGTLEIVYLEKESPDAKIEKYVRRLNSKKWQNREPREWFCEAITAQIESPIATNMADLADQQVVRGAAKFDWVTTYRFVRRKKPTLEGDKIEGIGWDPLLVFRDINTGLRPNDIDPKAGGWPTQKKGNGWYQPEILGEADFNELDLVDAFR